MDSFFIILPIVFFAFFVILIFIFACISRRTRYNRFQRRIGRNGGPVVVGPTALPFPSRPDVVYCPSRPYNRGVIQGFGPDVVVVTNCPGDGFYQCNLGGVISYYPNDGFIPNPAAHDFCALPIEVGLATNSLDGPMMTGMPLPPKYESGQFGTSGPSNEGIPNAGGSGVDGGGGIGGMGSYQAGCDLGPPGDGNTAGGGSAAGPSD